MSALYYYTARSPKGEPLRGSIEAKSKNSALAMLRTRAVFVTSLSCAGTPAGTLAAALQGGTLSRTRLVPFFRALATLAAAGVPLRRAIAVLRDECSRSRLGEALSSVETAIESGHSLSQAFAQHPQEFPPLYVAMIAAGEAGGTLEHVLERLAVLLERESAVRKRLAASLAYPAVVTLAAVALIAFLLVSIVPMFQSLYAQMRVPLPALTVMLVSAGTVLRSPLTVIFALPAVFVCVLAFCALRSTPKGAASLESALWKSPVLGVIVRKVHAARFARTLGSLLQSGVGITGALESVSPVVGAPLRGCIVSVREALSAGSSLHAPLGAARLFDPLFVQMVRVGEETGCLDAMLLRVAEYYEADLEAALSALGSLLEPAMILVLGGAVAFIVSSIFIPLYTLIGNMK